MLKVTAAVTDPDEMLARERCTTATEAVESRLAGLGYGSRDERASSERQRVQPAWDGEEPGDPSLLPHASDPELAELDDRFASPGLARPTGNGAIASTWAPVPELAAVATGVADALERCIASQQDFYKVLLDADAASDWTSIRQLASGVDALSTAVLAAADDLRKAVADQG